jgi:hypothetical protein
VGWASGSAVLILKTNPQHDETGPSLLDMKQCKGKKSLKKSVSSLSKHVILPKWTGGEGHEIVPAMGSPYGETNKLIATL